jgi:hypothetical protein
MMVRKKNNVPANPEDKKVDTPKGEDPKVLESIASNMYQETALEVVAEIFKIKSDYKLTQFKDTPSNCFLTVENADYEVSIKFKDKTHLDACIALKEAKKSN